VARTSDISSTEKLLNVIRDKKDGAPTQQVSPEPAPRSLKSDNSRPPLTFASPRRKSATVGIDIGHDYLRLVKVAESGGKFRIIDRKRLPLPSGASRSAPEFSAFLNASLTSFCGSVGQADLWVAISAGGVEVHHVRIPKVPKKQIANAVYWTAKKEFPFDEKEMVFDFELQGEVIERGITRLSAMVYTAPRQDIEDLKNLFSRIGWPLTGVSIIPFAMQNLFRSGWIPSPKGAAASLYIGNDFSRIDIYAEGNLVLTRGIKAGTNSMVEALLDRLNDMNKGSAIPSLTIEQGRKVVHSLSPDSPQLEESDAGFGLSKEDIFEMVQPALERLVRQVERTFEYYVGTEASERIANIYVSGAMSISKPMVDYVGDQLGIEKAVLDPLGQQIADDTQPLSERVMFSPALGLALSDNTRTPNLIFTYRDKEKATSVTRINRAILFVFVLLALICTSVFVYQTAAISGKKTEITGLEAQLARLGPSIDRDQLQKLVGKINERRQLSKVYADRYLGMVLISELATLTPANIRFLNLKMNLGPTNAVATADAAKTPPAAGAAKAKVEEIIVVEGLVLGGRQSLESSLAGFTLLLEASPLIKQVTVQKNTIVPYLKSEALHFILNMKVEEQVHG